jgi:hypothetical protein
MKWMVVAAAVGLFIPAALGEALLTQGSNEIGLAGQLDTSGVAGTDFDAQVKYAYFFWDRTSLGLRATFGNNDFWSYFGLGTTAEYNFRMPQGYRPVIGTDLVPLFLGAAIDYRHVNLDEGSDALVFSLEAGTKLFLTDSTAVVLSMIGEMGTEDIYYDKSEPTDKNLLFQLGLRFYF